MQRNTANKMAGSAKLKQLKSSWTPLTNEEANHKMFEERRTLVGKWFDKWSDGQRRQILADLVSRCKVRQLVYVDRLVSQKKPVFHEDVTRVLPRVITIYVFSYLDPRSLCRCAQVCWGWRNIVELDQLWMPKSIRRGWVLPFSPSPYETGTWKRLYVENASSLKYLRQPQDLPDSLRSQMERLQLTDRSRKDGTPRRPGSAKGPKKTPWRGSDPTPKDTWRNNYLENEDEVTKVNKLRQKGVYGPESEAIRQRAKNKVNSGTHVIRRPSSVPRSKSALSLHEGPGERPDWAKAPTQASVDLVHASIDNTTVTIARPAPVKPFLAPTRTKTIVPPKEPESEELFSDQPWQIPQDGYDSDT